MKLFVCIYDDARLLPHFLRHYARLGVSEFHIAAPQHLAAAIRRHEDSYKIVLGTDLDVADSFMGGVAAVTEMRRRAGSEDEWIVIVDLDEFLELPVSVDEMSRRIEAEGANIARGIMYDRFAESGQPTGFDENSVLATLYPVKARFTKDVMGGVDFKGVILKGHLKSQGAHHIFEEEKIYSRILEISHYKWNDRSLDRVRSAHELLSTAEVKWAWQYKAILDHYDTHGRFAWETFGGTLVGRG